MGITNPGEQYFKDGGWHWNGSVWIKGGLAFEYAAQILERVFVNDVAAGFVLGFGSVVPANEIWVATAMSITNTISGSTGRVLGVRKAGADYWLAADAGGLVNSFFSWGGILVAIEGQQFMSGVYGCTLHDYLRFTYGGYKMRLT